MKKCSKCKEVKDLGCFGVENRNKDNLSNLCRDCKNFYSRKNYKKNKNSDKQRKYRLANKDRILNYHKKWREENKDKIKEYEEKYLSKSENKENKNKYRKEHYLKNKEALDERQKKYNRDRRILDPLFKLKGNIRSSIYKSLKRSGYTKTSRTYKILGCKYKDFMTHLNSNKYNFKYEDELYDLDHIVPISSASTEEEIIKLNHYTNFQLLPSDYNQFIKRDKPWDQEHFEEWLKKESH